jgi:hypothetical protein
MQGLETGACLSTSLVTFTDAMRAPSEYREDEPWLRRYVRLLYVSLVEQTEANESRRSQDDIGHRPSFGCPNWFGRRVIHHEHRLSLPSKQLDLTVGTRQDA